jgi:hypothetical protein
MRVLTIAGDIAACHRYRALEPTLAMINAGITCDYFNPVGKPLNINLQVHKEVDLILVQRLTHPVLYQFVKNLVNQVPQAKVLYEQDDNLFDLDPTNPAYPYFQQKEIQNNIKDMYQLCHGLVVSTDELGRQLSHYYSGPIYTLHNLINVRRFKPRDKFNNGRINIGWSGGDCVDDQTEILTKNGFKFFKDLTYEDEIATLHSDGYAQWFPPDKIIDKAYNGPMYLVESDDINFCVTPRHKLFVSNNDLIESGPHLVMAKDINGGFSIHSELESFKYSSDRMKQIDYSGRIYCVEVPNHIFYSRRKGHCMWTGNSHFIDIKEIWSDLRYVIMNNDNVDMHFVGYLPTFCDLPRSRYFRHEWGTIDSYAETISMFDIAIAPLVNSKFASAKSAIKTLESGASLVPCVSSAVEPYTANIPNDIFPVCKNSKEWVKKLQMLIDSEVMRSEYAGKQRDYVLAHRNLYSNIGDRISTYAQIIGEEIDLSTLNLTVPEEDVPVPEEHYLQQELGIANLAAKEEWNRYKEFIKEKNEMGVI